MERKVLVWLTILAILALIMGYLMTQNNTTTTTTTLQQTSTTISPTTTRSITRPTQPTTTIKQSTTTQATTTTPTSSTTTTTIPTSSNATTSSTTTTTRTDHTNPQTTTTTTTTATTNPTTPTTTATTAPTTTPTTTATTKATTTVPTTTATTKATTTPTTTATTAPTTTPTTLPPSSSPILYLKFDESAGSTAYDSSGSNDAELRNGPTWTSGRAGNALRFDGINDYAYISTTSSLNIYNSITITAWIKPSTINKEQTIICKNWQSSYAGYELRVSPSGELMFRINPTATSVNYRNSSGAAIAANVWQHVAATYDGTNIRFYKNGALISTVAAGGRLYPTSSGILIGIYESEEDDQYSGTIDELRIYGRALTATEITQLYSTTPTTTPTTTATTKATTTPTTTATTKATTTPTTTATTKATTTPTTTATTAPTTTPTTLPPSTCKVGPGYTFSSTGTYTASSSSGVASISRSGQYTFYETPHNYADSMNCPWSGTYTCPAGTNIRFYLRAQTESGYDFLNIRNSGGTTYEQIDGDNGAAYAWTSTYNQRTAAFNFISDGGTINWGIDLYKIECTTPTTTTQTTTATTQATTPTTIPPQEDCYGSDCNPTGNPIGGGAGYSDIITSGDYTVTTASQLISALSSAQSGDVIFVPSTASIDISGVSSSLTIPDGVTLASDRGYAGSSGGLIYRNSCPSSLGTFDTGNNVRITGLRIKGCHSGYGTNYGDSVKGAIVNQESINNLEVDNCEIYDWSYCGVSFEHGNTGHIHHNYIHNIGGEGYGYGVAIAYGDVLIEANHFDYTRHAVIGEGCPGEKFEYRYNYYGANSLNPVLDCHRDCGGWSAGGVSGRLYLVHHNTIVYGGSVTYNLYGTPSEGAYIYNNRFAEGVQALNGPTRIFMTNNYVGGVFYSQGPIN